MNSLSCNLCVLSMINCTNLIKKTEIILLVSTITFKKWIRECVATILNAEYSLTNQSEYALLPVLV